MKFLWISSKNILPFCFCLGKIGKVNKKLKINAPTKNLKGSKKNIFAISNYFAMFWGYEIHWFSSHSASEGSTFRLTFRLTFRPTPTHLLTVHKRWIAFLLLYSGAASEKLPTDLQTYKAHYTLISSPTIMQIQCSTHSTTHLPLHSHSAEKYTLKTPSWQGRISFSTSFYSLSCGVGKPKTLGS